MKFVEDRNKLIVFLLTVEHFQENSTKYEN